MEVGHSLEEETAASAPVMKKETVVNQLLEGTDPKFQAALRPVLLLSDDFGHDARNFNTVHNLWKRKREWASRKLFDSMKGEEEWNSPMCMNFLFFVAVWEYMSWFSAFWYSVFVVNPCNPTTFFGQIWKPYSTFLWFVAMAVLSMYLFPKPDTEVRLELVLVASVLRHVVRACYYKAYQARLRYIWNLSNQWDLVLEKSKLVLTQPRPLGLVLLTNLALIEHRNMRYGTVACVISSLGLYERDD